MTVIVRSQVIDSDKKLAKSSVANAYHTATFFLAAWSSGIRHDCIVLDVVALTPCVLDISG